jgi:DNA-binding MarR family transcriptional regulator
MPLRDTEPFGTELLGTRLRHLLDTLERDVAAVYTDLGVEDIKPRFAPYLRLLESNGPTSIRDLATTIGVTHSAASQTVAELSRRTLVDVAPGPDARTRVVTLSEAGERILPLIHREWAATVAAAATLDADLPYPLGRLVEEALAALERRPMRERIRHHLSP